MKYVLNINETRMADAEAITGKGVPGLILMENAARSAGDFIKEKLPAGASVLILCGVGNNGGDGLALARHLQNDYTVRIVLLGDESKMSPETRTNFRAAGKLTLPLEHIKDESQIPLLFLNYDCIVDSLIGVGGSENLKGPVVNLLARANAQKAFKVAIDVPSGVNADTGAAHEHAFKADLTVTMFSLKKGLINGMGKRLSGEIKVADLGVPVSIVGKIAKEFILELADLRKLLPKRATESSKFDFGKVMIIAGSNKYPGAATLCANAAVKAGAGLVYLYSTDFSASLYPEVIREELSRNTAGGISSDNFDFILESAKKCNVIAIGPGIGDSDDTLSLVANLIKKIPSTKTLIIDADALKVIKSDAKLRPNIIITPHVGEFSLITGIKRDEIISDYSRHAQDFAGATNCCILLKNSQTVISDSKKTYYNTTGNPGLAKGGSGDVLTGLIAAMAAQGVSALEAASLGAFIHGRAADIYAHSFAEETLRATDLLDYLPYVFKDINE